MNNPNWTVEQTKRLFALCEQAKRDGNSLSGAFAAVSRETGRSVNSVRNYYYSQSKTFALVPEIADRLGIRYCVADKSRFVPFTQDQVQALLRSILTARAQGKSVRKAIAELSGGDEKTALRYQNKYRSTVRSHRALVEKIMAELKASGVPYVDPYEKPQRDNFARLADYLSALDSARVGKFISIIEKLT